MRRLAMRGVRAVLRRRLDRGRPAGGWTRRARRLLHALLTEAWRRRPAGAHCGALGRTGAHWGASMLPSPPTSAACKHGPTDCAGTRACAWRLANAYAGRDDVERACRAGRQAVDVIRAATSSRALSEVQRVRVRLAPWRRHAEVSELGDRIRGLLYPAG